MKSFIDEGFITGITIEAQRKGYLDQKIMARTFSYLRPNDLVYGPAVKALDDIKIPHYVVACEKDHIAPWMASFKGLSRLKGGGRFVLAQSGHIAGIVNHPDKKKYGYWVSDEDPVDLEKWRAGTQAFDGSWWPDWAGWLGRRSGKKIDAAESFPQSIPRLEPAPGRYVRE
jgi:polyhydroxyalkanoate synthase